MCSDTKWLWRCCSGADSPHEQESFVLALERNIICVCVRRFGLREPAPGLQLSNFTAQPAIYTRYASPSKVSTRLTRHPEVLTVRRPHGQRSSRPEREVLTATIGAALRAQRRRGSGCAGRRVHWPLASATLATAVLSCFHTSSSRVVSTRGSLREHNALCMIGMRCKLNVQHEVEGR